MTSDAQTPDEYVEQLPEDRRPYIQKLRNVINANIPKGFEECMNYGMIGWVVPHSIYPEGYHCDPKLPLPFMNIASQKNHIGLYNSGIYADVQIMNWWKAEYPKHVKTKLDMGKCCVRFKNPKVLPYDLIGELATKLTVQQWIELYEKNVKG